MTHQPTQADFERYHRAVADNIARHGRHIVGVFPNEDAADPLNSTFEYSIGNVAKGLPELLIIGMCEDTFTINRISRLMIERGKKFDDGEIVSLGGPVPVCMVDAADSVKDEFTVQAGNWWGSDDYRVMQVVVPDKSGKFPWQEGCAAPYCKVKVHRRKEMTQ